MLLFLSIFLLAVASYSSEYTASDFSSCCTQGNQCFTICTLGDGVSMDPSCFANCHAYYCPVCDAVSSSSSQPGALSSSSLLDPGEVEAVGFFDLKSFMFGFGAISICYFVSMPLRVVVRVLRSTSNIK